MISFPELTKDDIEVRVSRVNASVVELLLYKDARCDMRLLDEAVGPENWQRRHEVIDGALFCSVGIKCGGIADAPEWVWKQDCGTAGNFEAEKSKASDAFKRACFNWGIGRELYTAPEMAVWWNQDGERLCNCKQGDKGDWKCYDSFRVSQIVIEDHRIMAVSILDETTGKYVYRWDGRAR
jgi:hypothetical protein